MVIVQHVSKNFLCKGSGKQLAGLWKSLVFIKPDLDFPSKLTEKYFPFPRGVSVYLTTTFRTSLRVTLIEKHMQVNLYPQKEFKIALTFF